MTAMPPTRDELLREIVSRRNCGRVTCVVQSNGSLFDPYDLANAVAVAQGFKALGHKWWTVDREKALAIVTSLLHRDLAYDHPVMPEREARDLATGFLGLVTDARIWFTNGTWTEPPEVLPNGVARMGSWDPISEATFDAVLICVGARETALLCVEDED
jgi:hypothetical protein